MPFEWKSQIVLASRLLENPPAGCAPEAVYRTVVSRIYYACYGTAREVDVRLHRETLPDSGSVHADLRDRYIRKGIAMGRKEYRLIADNLKQLFAHRRKADYFNDFNDPERSARACERIGLKLIGQLDALTKGP
jgi:hypothetical protein